jgi:hypothetical protein
VDTKEGHANPLYQYPTVKNRASKKTAPRIRAMGRITPEQANIAAEAFSFWAECAANRAKIRLIIWVRVAAGTILICGRVNGEPPVKSGVG